jgi:hypothetical protein
MSQNVTLATIRTRVRQRADIEGATARHTDAEINDQINESNTEFRDLLRSAFGQSYERAAQTFTTVAGTAQYALPSDFLSLVSVDIFLGNSPSGVKYSATPFLESERNRYAGFGAWSIFGRPVSYHLFGQNLTFIPTPSAAVLVQLNYTPTTPKLVNDGDTCDEVNGWIEYVVLDAAIKSLLKDEGYEKIQVLEGRKAAIRERIIEMATERDSGQPSRVNDVQPGGSGYSDGLGGDFGGPGW